MQRRIGPAQGASEFGRPFWRTERHIAIPIPRYRMHAPHAPVLSQLPAPYAKKKNKPPASSAPTTRGTRPLSHSPSSPVNAAASPPSPVMRDEPPHALVAGWPAPPPPCALPLSTTHCPACAPTGKKFSSGNSVGQNSSPPPRPGLGMSNGLMGRFVVRGYGKRGFTQSGNYPLPS